MSRNHVTTAFARLAAANPYPTEMLRDVQLEPPALMAREDELPARPRRVRMAVAIAACALAVVAIAPALAVSERVRELFGFSTSGTPVPISALGLYELSSLERVGFSDGVRKLGDRAGTAFYVGRSRSGALCFATGPTTAPRPAFGVLACQGAQGVFPSRQRPIADFSPMRGHEGSSDVYVWKLVGFAADGVAAVAVRDVSGALHSTPAVGNVYASGELPAVPATEIVALAADGRVLYAEPLVSSTPG
jgi:hypothetical protein